MVLTAAGSGWLGEALAVGVAGSLIGLLLHDIDGAVHGLHVAELLGREAAGSGVRSGAGNGVKRSGVGGEAVRRSSVNRGGIRGGGMGVERIVEADKGWEIDDEDALLLRIGGYVGI